MKIYKTLFISFVLFLVSNQSFALSLEEYLSQTQKQNLGYISSQISAKSSDLISKKAFLLTSPNFFVDAQTGFEKQNQAIAFVRYNKLKTENYSVGFEQDFSFGLSGKFYYNLSRNEYQGLNSNAFIPISYETNPVLQLTVPLWQGVLGKQIKAKEDALYYTHQSDNFNFQANSISFAINAEKSYWQLVVARKIALISKDALLQAEKLLKSVSRKKRMNLGEEADVLQAKADVETKKLQLKQAENDVKIAARNFNQKRYINSDLVEEKLSEIDFVALEKIIIKTKMPDNRADVKVAAVNAKLAVANAKIEEESNKPKLDLSGQYGLNGLEIRRSNAINNSFSQNGDEAYIGIKFSMPLAIGLQSDIKRGAKASASAARMNYRQKVFDQEQDWQNLLQNLQNYQENLRFSRQIEGLQKLKLENERSLLKKGRTSTYQVLLFEQDYNQARINTIKNAYQLLSLIADKKEYDN